MASTKTGITVDDIKNSYLYGLLLTARGETESYLDKEIENKIRAAEDFYETNLNIFIGIKKCISAATERGIVVDPDKGEFEEPGYDYDRDWWVGNHWGNIPVRNRPIVPDRTVPSGITRFVFAFPSAHTTLFEVPQDWIKPNFQFGQMDIVPASAAIFASFSPWFLSVATGGAFGIPKVIYIDYFAGYDPTRLKKDHADLLEGIKLRTTLLLGGIISNILTLGLQSNSIGLDGLSHSRGFGSGKYGAYSGFIENCIREEEAIRSSFRNKEKGIVVGFV